VYGSLEELADLWRCERRFEPMMSKSDRDRLYAGWIQAVHKL